ncbi:hypothetical protein SUGI_0855570 [Cryptomeria japonica]|nr:hypothetical protein SUGI_0855570 [Cryptomeria japonica]
MRTKESHEHEQRFVNPVKWRILEVDWDEQTTTQKDPKEGNNNRIVENRHYEEIDTKRFGFKIEIVGKFLPKGFFVAIFSKKPERDHILEKENWYSDNHPLYIQPWTPNFDPTALAVYEEPVWVRLFNLPIEYWSESSLEKIGQTLGTLLEIDEDIIESDLYTYVRLKIAAVKTIPQSVTIPTLNGEWNQRVEDEKENRACHICDNKFHLYDRCKMFVRRAFNRPQRKPRQEWRKKLENSHEGILMLEAPKNETNPPITHMGDNPLLHN